MKRKYPENPNIIITCQNDKKIKNSFWHFFKFIQNEIVIDLSNIENCTIEMINTIKEYSKRYKISIFNIPSDIFVMFNLTGIDKYAKLYVSELDYKEHSRQLINRNFYIV